MRKIKAVELSENKKLPIIIICIAVFMLILSVIKLEFPITDRSFGLNDLASVVSVLPLTAGVSAFMLIKTKKNIFGEFPCYVIAVLIAMGFVIMFILKLIPQGMEVFGFAVGILLIYPYIIAGLTIRGCVYNRVFALAFAGILLVISLVAVVVISVLISGFIVSLLILPLMYAELILTILCFELKPIKRKKEEYESIL